MAVIPLPHTRPAVGADGQAGPPAPGSPEARARKKKDKIRSAWISFAGRIVAQIVGALATVTLTLLVVQHVKQAPPAGVQANSGTNGVTVAAAGPSTPTSAGDTPLPAGRAIAVLPLDNYSGDPSQAYLADGMTEALVAELAHIDNLRVISRTSSMRYRGSAAPLPEIARQLGVSHLIEGSISRDKSRVRVTAQLIEAGADRHVWARTYDGTTADILELQATIAREIAADVEGALGPR
jgi:TolB-like protein